MLAEVLAVDPPNRLVWRTLPTRLLPDSTEWTFELLDEGDHTRLTESMRILQIPGPHERLFAMMLPQHREEVRIEPGFMAKFKSGSALRWKERDGAAPARVRRPCAAPRPRWPGRR